MTEIKTHLTYTEAELIVTSAEEQVARIIHNPADYRPTEVESTLNIVGAHLTEVRLYGLPHFLTAQQESLVRRVLPLLDRMKAAQDLLVEPHRVEVDEETSIIFDKDLPPV